MERLSNERLIDQRKFLRQTHKQEEVRTIQRRVEIVHDYFASEAECCVPSGLTYCDTCDSGPSCCVYLSDEGEHDSSDPTSSSLEDVVESSVDEGGRGGGGEEEDYNEEDEEVIHFYLPGDGMEEGLVEEYVFYVDDDDEDDDDKEGEMEYYEDEEEGHYVMEDEEGEYILDGEEGEYCVDDDEGEWEEEMEEEEEQQQRQRRSRRSREHFYPRSQEPLEVILEILGEEGEEEESQTQHQSASKEEDLITFSSSSEYSPDSLEEASKKKAKDEDSSPDDDQQLSDATLTPRDEVMEDEIGVMYMQLTEAEQDLEFEKEEQETNDQESNIQNLMDEPILEECPSVILPRPSLIRESQESDREKLRALTSEIEAYLKETTMLLESATTYTSKTAKPREPSIEEKKDSNVSFSSAERGAVPPSTLNLKSNKQSSQSTEKKTEITTASLSPSPVKIHLTAPPSSPTVVPPPDVRPRLSDYWNHEKVSESISNSHEGILISHLMNNSPQDFLNVSRKLNDSSDCFKSLGETTNLEETQYYSAKETSTEVVEALEWESKQGVERKKERIIYKPPERSPEEDECFATQKNRRSWLARFEELESSFDDAMKNDKGRLSQEARDSPRQTEEAAIADNSCNSETERQKRPTSRCESPPPTMSCLENLEKLCRRLSLEREKYSEHMCSIDRPSPVGIEDNRSLHDEGNVNIKNESEVLHQIHHFAEENENITVTSYDNHRVLDENVSQHIPLYDSVGFPYEENGVLDPLKENESNVRRGDTKESLKFQYIDSKLDEIFSSVEHVGAHNISSYLTTQMQGDNRFQTGQKQVQKQLNDILSGMDCMYESYLEKKKIIDLTRNRDAASNLERKTEVKNEFEAFKDIIDISEDLKNLCVFHVNKPGWEEISDTHSRSATHREGGGGGGREGGVGGGEGELPDFYDSDGATPEAEMKAFPPPEEDPRSSSFSTASSMTSSSSSSSSSTSRRASKEVEDHLGSFLTTMKGENLRCYEVTLDYLRKISASQEDLRENRRGDVIRAANQQRHSEDKVSSLV